MVLVFMNAKNEVLWNQPENVSCGASLYKDIAQQFKHIICL